MNKLLKQTLMIITLLMATTALMFLSGCARYARTINTLYEPGATVRGGSGEVYIVIPENQQTKSPDIKWVIGVVKNDDNKKIDELLSSRSPAELAQSALSQELKRAGYTVLPAVQRPEKHTKLIDISKIDISLDQLSDFADIKATCRVQLGMDLYKNGTLIRKLQYESSATKTDIKDRDLLAQKVLQDALQSAMLNATPDLVQYLEK
jgi:uncharacterized lipoprotein YajG